MNWELRGCSELSPVLSRLVTEVTSEESIGFARVTPHRMKCELAQEVQTPLPPTSTGRESHTISKVLALRSHLESILSPSLATDRAVLYTSNTVMNSNCQSTHEILKLETSLSHPN